MGETLTLSAARRNPACYMRRLMGPRLPPLFLIGIASFFASGCYVSHPGSAIDPSDSSITPPDTSTDGPRPGDSMPSDSIVPIDSGMDSDVRPDSRPRDTSPGDSRPRDTSRDAPPVDSGRPSRALSFERGQRAFVSPSVTLDLTGSHTYELWVRPRGDGLVLHKGDVTADNRYQYLVEIRGGTVVVGWATEEGDALVRGLIRLGVWNHLSVVIDANPMSASITLYVDGVEAESFVFPNTLFDAINDHEFEFGGFSGDIDEVRLFTFARTASAIRSTMRTRLSPPPPGMEAYWPMEESGQIILDRALRGNEGVLGDFTFPDPADPEWIRDGPIP